MTPYFDIETEYTEQGVVAHLNGELDANTAQTMSEELVSILQLASLQALVLDCSQLSYISSAGLGILLSLAKTCQETTIHLVLCHLQPQVQNVLEITGMIKMLQIAATLQEAFGDSTGS